MLHRLFARSHRCRTCGFQYPDARAFRREPGYLGFRETVCFGCRPWRPSAFERGALRAWTYRAILSAWMLYSWSKMDGGLWLALPAWLAMLAATPLTITIHEAGHQLAARLVGFEVVSVRVGRGPEVRTGRFAGVRWSFRRYGVLGGATMYIAPDDAPRWRKALFFAGGLLVNLGAVVVLLALGVALDAADVERFFIQPILAGLLFSNASTILANAWPSLGEDGPSDGAQLLGLFRRPAEPEASLDPRLALWKKTVPLLEAHRYAEARDVFVAQLTAWPNDPYLLGMVIHTTMRIEGPREALRRHEQLAADAPAGPPRPFDWHADMVGWLGANIAWALIQADTDLPRADAAMRVALAAVPDAPEVKATLGALRVRQGQLEAGEALLTEAMRATEDPLDRADFAAFIAIARRARGDEQGAASADALADHLRRRGARLASA